MDLTVYLFVFFNSTYFQIGWCENLEAIKMPSHNVSLWLSGYINSHCESSWLYREVFFSGTCLRICLWPSIFKDFLLYPLRVFLQVPRRLFFPPTIFYVHVVQSPPPPTPHLLHPFHATLPFLILLFLLFIFFICLRPRPAHPPTHNYRNMNEPNTMNTRHVGWRDVMFQGQTYYIFLSDFWYVEAGDRLLGVCEWTRSKSGQKQVESVTGYILRCLSLICFLFSMGGKVNVSKRHTRVLYLLLSFSCRGDEEQVKVCLPENNWYVVFVWSYALEISHHNAVIESNKWCF